MGRIAQLSEYKHLLISVESKSFNITQWRMLKPTVFNNVKGVNIYIDAHVFFVEDISIDDINILNYNNQKGIYTYHFKHISLACAKCSGTGIIDWVDRATGIKEKNHKITINSRYIRDKKGLITILKYCNKDRSLSSVPIKKIGDEYCTECYGSGIKIKPMYVKIGNTYFDNC